MTTYCLAVIVMLNGVQIWLPRPAFILSNQVFIPAREIFQRMGWTVKWQEADKSFVLSAPGQETAVVRIGDPVVRVGQRTEKLSAAPLQRNGISYVPAQAVQIVTGATLAWDNEHKALDIQYTLPGMPPVTTPGQLAEEGPAQIGREVVVIGEYMGWHADPLDPLVSQGPPRTRSDWILRSVDGSIYCVATSEMESAVALSPVEDTGRRIKVTGSVAIARDGFVYLVPRHVEALQGLAGLTRYVQSNRMSYRNGETAVFTLHVANPNPEPVQITFRSGQRYDFVVKTRDGKKIWRWSDDRMFTMAIGSRTLAPGEAYDVQVKWTVQGPEGKPLAPSIYQVHAEVTPELQTYPQLFEVTDK